MIKQNIWHIKKIEASTETYEKKTEGTLRKTIHSSEIVLTWRKTAHDFDEQKLSKLQAFKTESHPLITSLSQLQETCKHLSISCLQGKKITKNETEYPN